MEEQQIIRLIYLSQSRGDLTESQLSKILSESRKNNSKNNLTGLLCYGVTSFIQVLEGPETEVILLYARIIRDNRHHQCRILDIHVADERIFDEWAMAHVKSSEDDFNALSKSIQGACKKHHQASREVASVLRKYLGDNVKMTSVSK